MMYCTLPPSVSPHVSNATLPTPPCNADVTTVLEPGRRSPAPGASPPMRVSTSDQEHVLSVDLPGFAPDMVTISAKKGEALAVVADMWHAENDCHHEWLVNFPPRDANMASVRAKFAPDGMLTIRVSRRAEYMAWNRFL